MSLADSLPMRRPARHRSTRDRPAKAPLSVDAVVDAALAILKSDGVDAVTMRRVAAALDTGAASLYVYVPGREGLLQAMLDRVTATIELETPGPSRWRAQLYSLLERTRRALVAHPGIAGMTLANSPTTDAVLRLTENLLGILLAGGLDPQGAAWACDILVSLVTAVAREDDVRRARGRTDDAGRPPKACRRTPQNLRRVATRAVPSSRRSRGADGRRRCRRAVPLRHRCCCRGSDRHNRLAITRCLLGREPAHKLKEYGCRR